MTSVSNGLPNIFTEIEIDIKNSDNLEKESLAKDFIRKGCKNRNFTKTFTCHKNKVGRNFR